MSASGGPGEYILGIKKAVLLPLWVFNLRRSVVGAFAVPLGY